MAACSKVEIGFTSRMTRFPAVTPIKKPRISAGLVIAQTFYLPVPVRLDVCGLPTALSATLNDPVLVPVAVGVNTTLIAQLPLAPGSSRRWSPRH